LETKTLSRHFRLIVHVLSLALLIAQLGTQAHAYSHLSPDPHGVPSTIQSCGQCLSFAPLLTAVGGSHCLWLADRCETERIVPVNTIQPSYRQPYPAFRSRAPPALI
jgi:hypothetical protein